jgi:hypothetical protein
MCGVSNTAIHDWIRKGHVSLLKHAVDCPALPECQLTTFLTRNRRTARRLTVQILLLLNRNSEIELEGAVFGSKAGL